MGSQAIVLHGDFEVIAHPVAACFDIGGVTSQVDGSRQQAVGHEGGGIHGTILSQHGLSMLQWVVSNTL